MPRDYYEVLGVGRDADEAELKNRFRRLPRELHPDVNTDDPEAEARFKEVAEAYHEHSDAERRATYDRYGHEGLKQGGSAPNFDTFGSFADIFDAFLGGGMFGGGGRGGPAPGGGTGVPAEIDLVDAARGTSVEVTYEAVSRCPTCHGNGAEPGTPIETCPRCQGSGQLRAVTRTPFGQVVRATACDVCDGSGKRATTPCHTCEGRVRMIEDHTVSVDVPAGLEDGQRIRLSGRGHAGDRGGSPGDLYVLVRVKEDPRFVRDGNDLVTVADVPAPLAALGATLEAPTLDGPIEVELEPGTQPGEVKVVRGAGMPALRSGRSGRLRV